MSLSASFFFNKSLSLNAVSIKYLLISFFLWSSFIAASSSSLIFFIISSTNFLSLSYSFSASSCCFLLSLICCKLISRFFKNSNFFFSSSSLFLFFSFSISCRTSSSSSASFCNFCCLRSKFWFICLANIWFNFACSIASFNSFISGLSLIITSLINLWPSSYERLSWIFLPKTSWRSSTSKVLRDFKQSGLISWILLGSG